MTTTGAANPFMLELEMEEEEIEGLMGSSFSSGNIKKPALGSHLVASPSMMRQRRMVGLLIVAGIGLLMLVLPWLSHSDGVTPMSTTRRKKNKSNTFQCPSQLVGCKNHEDREGNSTYLAPDKQPIFDDHFLETFRETKFDGWGHTFNEIKAYQYEWKAKHYAPYLKNGSSIYESACGLGLKLYLTLEILQETASIGELTVYGNEYVGANAATAGPMLDVLLKNQAAGNVLGGVCQGDSTDLSWVAPNQFDLVFTGYISPLWDPLDFGLDFKGNYRRMKTLCKLYNMTTQVRTTTQDGDSYSESQLENSHWMEAKLLDIARQRQEDWFNTWVQELVRIAKPGAPVIVEEVAFPYCDILHDYDGVSQEFWKTGSEVYGWDIDPESIEFAYKNGTKRRRYHVFMKKNV